MITPDFVFAVKDELIKMYNKEEKDKKDIKKIRISKKNLEIEKDRKPEDMSITNTADNVK